jgi:hypothetical protein
MTVTTISSGYNYSVCQEDLVSLAVHSFTQRLHSRTFYNFGYLAGKINTTVLNSILSSNDKKLQQIKTDEQHFCGFFLFKSTRLGYP